MTNDHIMLSGFANPTEHDRLFQPLPICLITLLYSDSCVLRLQWSIDGLVRYIKRRYVLSIRHFPDADILLRVFSSFSALSVLVYQVFYNVVLEMGK